MTTQNDRVLRHLKEIGPLTQAEAITEYGIYRLGARVYDLRKKGYNIQSETVTKRNRYGELTSFSKYSLNENKD